MMVSRPCSTRVSSWPQFDSFVQFVVPRSLRSLTPKLSQTIPMQFPNVPKRPQAISNQFPNDSQISPNLCLMSFSFNTCHFPERSHDHRKRHFFCFCAPAKRSCSLAFRRGAQTGRKGCS
jgi:hypothetical protein